MRIAFYEVQESWERNYIERNLEGEELVHAADPLEAGTLGPARGAEVVSVFIRSRVDRAVLQELPDLRLIATRSTGYDHIDMAACAERDVTVVNVPRYGENTVAEHTFGLILALSRKIPQAQERTRACDFSLEGLEGMDLRGKVLGVVGAGNIGLHVIRIARAFEMNVLAYDVSPQTILAEVLGFRYVSLDDLLQTSDVVTLHAPLLPATHHLIDRDRFSRMKRGVLLVNTARGPLVDTEALLWALKEGIVAGAALDVIEGEESLAEEQQMFRTPASERQLREMLRGHMLLDRENVIVTPHIGWFSREAQLRIYETTLENIAAFAAGHPVNEVAGGGG